MFNLRSNNTHLSLALIDYLQSKGVQVSLEQNKPSFANVVIEQYSHMVEIACKSQFIKLTTPKHIQSYSENIISLLKKIQFNFGELIYFPYHQDLECKKKKIKIKNIHNIILSNLFLYSNQGIEKQNLYQIIWPYDKSYHMNKLDTHLTNLKKELKISLNFDLDFFSYDGNLKLRIN